MESKNTLEYAQSLDAADALKQYRDKFHMPLHNGKEMIYLCGNSLGLQPKSAKKYIDAELEKWAAVGVLGHHEGDHPWLTYVDELHGEMAKVVGGKSTEVVIMNSLTVNVHLLLVSFYRPSGDRNKILIDGNAFCSDRYAVYSQVELHGLDPAKVIIEMKPREGETSFREEDVIEMIEKNADTLATVWLEGVNFYNGKVYDIKKVIDAGHKVGALVGFDLAHAAGNIELKLHDWELDFACWCSYKYLNSGPGSLGAAFIHEKHHNDPNIPVLTGWWSNRVETRFLMAQKIDKHTTAEKWQMSNPSIFAACPMRASLELFNEVGMEALLKKSKALTTYLEEVLLEINAGGDKLKIITPKDYRGCQVSVVVKGIVREKGKAFVDDLSKHGAIVDWREPDVVRCAAAPFYNSFEDIFKFGQVFKKLLEEYKV